MADLKRRAKASATELKGKAKARVGKATGNRRLQARGVLEQAKGKTQKAVVKAKRVLNGTTKKR